MLFVSSAPLSSGVVALLLGVVVAIYFMRYNLYSHPTMAPYAQSIASIMNTIVIMVSNPLYYSFATTLTGLENHRTDSQG